jgi:beta-aspartyl-peptidase (threonine type)
MKRLFILTGLIVCLAFNIDYYGQEKFGIVIHGGAGVIKDLPADLENQYKAKLSEALEAGYKILESGGSSLDAVTKAINIMEDSPLFNAGKGAVLNDLGFAELDASIMDGSNLNAGAVAGIRHIKNPINLARLVMEKSPHVMLIGQGAEEFAFHNSFEYVDSTYFITERRFRQYIRMKKQRDSAETLKGTVGAVALDKNGNLAAGTSTGGMMLKKFGRVGDSPIIGAGTYANNNTCAVSATGHGEFFIRLGVAKDISDLMEYKKMSLNEAADIVINKKLVGFDGDGGVIAIDRYGNYAMPFNTPGMFRGVKISDGAREVKIYK